MTKKGLKRKPVKGDIVTCGDNEKYRVLGTCNSALTPNFDIDGNICMMESVKNGHVTCFIWNFSEGLNTLATIED